MSPEIVGEPSSVAVPSGSFQVIEALQLAPIEMRSMCVPVTAYTESSDGDQASWVSIGSAASKLSSGTLQTGPSSMSAARHA